MKRPLFSSLILLASTLPLLTHPARSQESADFSHRANALCRDIIAARDYEMMEGAQSGMLDLVIEAMRDEPSPTPERAQALSALLEASRDELAATVEALRAIAPGDAETTRHLETIFADAQYKIDIREMRIGLLANAGSSQWEWPIEDLLDVHDGPSGPEMEAAWDALGFAGRDCQFIFYFNGLPPEYASYWPQAAAICSTIYERRVTQPFTDWQDEILQAVIAVRSGDTPGPAVATSAQNLAAEWAQAARDLSAIAPESTPIPQEWAALLASVEANAEVYSARAKAIEVGDIDRLWTAFTEAIPNGFDAGSVGMEQSSCMAVSRLS
jgi:hypothetical protein